MKISIIDYGSGNILSIKRSIEYLGHKTHIVKEKKDFKDCKKIILPGVGSFPAAMKEIKKRNFLDEIKKAAKKEIPILGICLGMQILMEKGEEKKITKGLGLIKGNVKKINSNFSAKVPNIGWNFVKWNLHNYKNKILKDDFFYFVHSYQAIPENKNYQIGHIDYGGKKVCAVIKKDKVLGCQFHPEKSSKEGLNFLNFFINEFN